METAVNPQTEKMLKSGFKYVNRFMVLMFRLGLGPFVNIWPEWGGQILVLTHTGRKSGKRYRSGINYVIVDGEIYCMAGFGPATDWYRNLKANPQVEVWLPDEWWEGRAEEAGVGDQRLPLIRKIAIASGFAGRMAGINPHTMTDAALDALTKDYKLVRIHRTQPCTGKGGPNELAWIWPAIVLTVLPLLPFLLGRKPRRKNCC